MGRTGADAATEGTAITVTIAQARGTLSGPGFVRQVDARGFVIAATLVGITGAAGGISRAAESYFLAGTLVRDDEGVRWRGRGRWAAAADPSLTGEWHVAEWPAIEPPSRPQLSTSVRLEPADASGASGVVTLVALPEGETRFELQATGLTPATNYDVRLYAGTMQQPSASFTQVATVIADAEGWANAYGLVRFRGTEAIPLLDIAGGDHFLTIVGSGQTVAAGAIPALQPLG